jgi:daunorubicin resistance ABC transporter ATP-binding subunit
MDSFFAIEVSGLTKVYNNSFTALNGVDLEVHQGEVFSLLGPNGAGKTTLMRILTTQIKPSSGVAKVFGYDVLTQGSKVREIIGYVPQEFSVWTDLTAYENLRVYSRLYNINDKRKIYELLDFMDLSDFSNKTVKTFSGGMIRRLEIACALLTEPKVLFLDEPTVGLDPAARQNVWKRLKGLNDEKGITIFFNTHYIEEAELYSKRVAIINKGKVIKVGKVEELKKDLGFEVISLRVGNVEKALAILNSFSKKVSHNGKVIDLFVSDAEAMIAKVIKALENEGVEVERASIHKPTLEEVFISQVKKEETIRGKISEIRNIRRAVRRG